jgi:hypothetical protein
MGNAADRVRDPHRSLSRMHPKTRGDLAVAFKLGAFGVDYQLTPVERWLTSDGFKGLRAGAYYN